MPRDISRLVAKAVEGLGYQIGDNPNAFSNRHTAQADKRHLLHPTEITTTVNEDRAPAGEGDLVRASRSNLGLQRLFHGGHVGEWKLPPEILGRKVCLPLRQISVSQQALKGQMAQVVFNHTQIGATDPIGVVQRWRTRWARWRGGVIDICHLMAAEQTKHAFGRKGLAALGAQQSCFRHSISLKICNRKG